jgi:NDP-sugar pyrophosphorylase family protein
MAPVAGRPFLEYLLEQLHAAGCTHIVLCVGHQANIIEQHFGYGNQGDVTIGYSREQELLGTAGALALARPLIRSDPFLVLNGDSYCVADFQALLAQHEARKAFVTIVATQVEDTSRYGSMVLSTDDAIMRFCEKGQAEEGAYVNAGIYVLNRAVLDLIPSGKRCSIEHEVFPSLAGRGLYAFRQSGPFIDIGTPDSFHIAQTFLPELWRQGPRE